MIKTKEGKAQLKNEIDFWLDEIYRPYNARELRIASEAGTATGRNIDLFCGNRNIFNKFKQEKNRYLNLKVDHQLTHRQNIAVQCIRGDIQKQLSKTNNILTTGKLDKKLDIKRELYRFGEQFITNLGFYYGCKNQNTIDIVIELKNRKVINETTANKLIDYMKFAHEMRLKEQAVLKRQGFAVYFDQDKFNEDKKALEDELASLQNVIDYMSKLYHVDAEELSTKKREYEHLKSDLEHLKEMDAKKIFSKEDIERLKSHYVPLGKEIFEIAKKWSDNQQLSRAAPAATTPVIKTISPAWAHFKVQNKNKRKRLPKVIAKLFKFRKI